MRSYLNWAEISILVEKAKQGDQVAFGKLFDCFRRKIYMVALEKVQHQQDAEDLVQDVFSHAMKKLPQLQHARAFPCWLRTITIRMAQNLFSRGKIKFSRLVPDSDSVDNKGLNPLAALERNESNLKLLHAIRRLNSTDASTLEAFYFRGRSLKQMAREFNAPVGTIKRRLHVARERLRLVLEAAGENPSQASAFLEQRRRLYTQRRQLVTV